MKQLLVSDEFLSELDLLTSELKERSLEKIRLLSENPAHPSLNAHKLNRVPNKWECYISMSHRLIYEFQEEEIRLWRIGDHSIIDQAHIRSFSPHTSFRRLEQEGQVDESQSGFQIPAEWLENRDEQAENPFRFVPASHLRILGVPSELIPVVRSAPSPEEAVSVPGLPKHTQTWLMELMTDPVFEDSLFDQHSLLFRTTLDRLEGYCQGKIKRLMLNLEPEQQEFVNKPINGPLMLKGCAGSGKTTVALYRAVQSAQTGGKTIFLTFNRTLANAAQSLIEELIGPLPANLEIANIDAWLVRFLRGRGYSIDILGTDEVQAVFREALQTAQKSERSYVYDFHWSFFRDEIGRVIKGNGLLKQDDYLAIPRYGRKSALRRKARAATWAVYEAYQEQLKSKKRIDWQDISLIAYRELFKKALDKPYEHVIIDEAQDLTSIQVRVAQRMMGGGSPSGTRSIFLVGDVSQTLYSRGFSWKQAGLVLQGRSHNLRKNFRNTRQIAEAAAGLNSYNRLMQLSEDYVDPKFTSRQGPRPIVLDAVSNECEIATIIDKTLDLAGDNRFRLADFAILCPTLDLCAQVGKKLGEQKVPYISKGDDLFDILEEKMKVLTIHSAKGLEFPVVFVLGLHDGTMPQYQKLSIDDEEKDLALERDRTLFYVAMTRAAEMLYLVTSKEKPSRFISEIEKLIRVEPCYRS